MPDDLALLMALRVQGIAGSERAGLAIGNDGGAGDRLPVLVDAGLAKERTGRVCGFSLTPDGLERLDKLLADEGLRSSPVLIDAYDKFLLLNKRVLQVSSDWQMRSERGVEEPNDHSDPDYDRSVIARLAEIDARARTCIDAIAVCAPRYAPYGRRLTDCVRRLQAGDHKAFTAPLAESYHTVWFELHQDLLLTLGLEREE